MVATDIAARGIHVDDIDLVVHVDPPAEHKAYLHRSGRTARAGNGGDVVTLVLPEQRGDFRALARAAKIDAAPVRVGATDDKVLALVGDLAPAVSADKAPAAASRKPVAQPQGSGGGRRRGGAGRPGAPAATGAGRGARTGGTTRTGNAGRGAGAGRADGSARSDGGRSGGGRSGGRSSGGSRTVWSSSAERPADGAGRSARGSRRATAPSRSV